MSTLRRFSSSDPGLPNRPSRRHLAMMILRRVMGERGLKGLISVLQLPKSLIFLRSVQFALDVSVSILSLISLGPQDPRRSDRGLGYHKTRACEMCLSS